MKDPVIHIFDPDFKVHVHDISLTTGSRLIVHLARGKGECDVWAITPFEGIGANKPTHRYINMGVCRDVQ